MNPNASQGMILISVMGLVLALSIAVLAALDRSIINQRINASAGDRVLALQAAQTALREMEAGPGQWPVNRTLSTPDAAQAEAWQAWLEAHGQALAIPPDSRLSRAPRGHVERLKPRDSITCATAMPPCGYRISVLAYGKRLETVVILQSVWVDDHGARIWRELR